MNQSFSQDYHFIDLTDSLNIIHTDGDGGFAGAGGVSMIDYNEDGYDDITFVSTVNYPVDIFQCSENNINLTNFFDYGYGYNQQVKQFLWVDYDNDGDKDLFALGFLGLGSRLYKNLDGLLLNVTSEVGLNMLIDPALPSHAAAWVDYDKDGFLDLFIGNRPVSIDQIDLTNLMFKNQGDGTFVDVTENLHLDEAMTVNTLSFVDINNDTWPDLYVAVDKFVEANVLYINNQGNSFDKITSNSNFQTDADIIMDAMSVENGDYDNDGDLDIYITNGVQGNVLLRNDGDGMFVDVAPQLGLEINKFMWGANFFDYNNDGWLDLLACSQIFYPSDSIPGLFKNPLFRNLGNGTFEEVNNGIHLDTTSSSYGSAIGDINNDGYYDVTILNSDSTFSKIYQNTGGSNHWVKLNLEGTLSNRDAIGTWIKVYAGNNKYVRYTTCGNGYNSQNSDNIIIGVGIAPLIDSISIEWPSSLQETYYNVIPNQTYHYIEGEAPDTTTTVQISNLNTILLSSNPNPITNNTITVNGIKGKIFSIQVYDTKGYEYPISIIHSNSEKYIFKANNLPKGLYCLKVKTNFKNTYMIRFIKL